MTIANESDPTSPSTLWRFSLPIASGILSVVGLALLWTSWTLLNGQEWNAPRELLQLRAGTSASLEFRAETSGPYDVRLDTHRVLDSIEQNCLLGIALGGCPGRDEIDVSWQVISSGQVIAAGRDSGQSKNGGYWTQLNSGRVINTIHARRGQVYRVEVVINKTAPTLQRAQPALVVAIPGDVQKGYYVGHLLLGVAGCLSLAIATILLMVFAVKRSRRPLFRRSG